MEVDEHANACLSLRQKWHHIAHFMLLLCVVKMCLLFKVVGVHVNTQTAGCDKTAIPSLNNRFHLEKLIVTHLISKLSPIMEHVVC
jgi:hypothetical protein